MDYQTPRATMGSVLALAGRQHGVVSRAQLLALGMSAQAIKYRVARGRLFPIFPGVYAVGTPHVTREGRWMAAVLACGEGAVLSHASAATLWGLREATAGPIEVTVPARRTVRRRDILVHRAAILEPVDLCLESDIPVTTAIRTIVDTASTMTPDEIAATISRADARDLVKTPSLRAGLARFPHQQPGVAKVRAVLDAATFALTDSQLERRFIPLARRAGLPMPLTGKWVNGFKVDFYWPDLGLVVETDGLRYHRSPTQQARDRRRDQAHTAAGLTQLRFTHDQIAHRPAEVEAILTVTAARLRSR